MTPARPNLAAVLAALTDTDESEWWYWLNLSGAMSWFTLTTAGVEFTLRHWPFERDLPWITTDAAFAWEVLQTRGIIPDGYVGRFACRHCGGTGRVVLRNDLVDYVWVPCLCPGPLPRPTPHPPSVPDLVAWASLGFAASDDGTPGIYGIEELAQRMRRDARVQWRVWSNRPRPYFIAGFDTLLDSDLNIITVSAPPLRMFIG